MCSPHEWKETGERRPHVEGAIFIHGTSVAIYLRCAKCRQNGFRFVGKRLIYTWSVRDR